MKNSEFKLGSSLKKLALKWTFALVLKLIQMIKNVPARLLLEMSLPPIQDVVDIVTDREPDNGKQLDDLLEEKGGAYAVSAMETTKAIILHNQKLDDKAKKTVSLLINVSLSPVKDITAILTDKDPNNMQQLQTLLQDKGLLYGMQLLQASKVLIEASDKMNTDVKQLILETLSVILEDATNQQEKINLLSSGAIGSTRIK